MRVTIHESVIGSDDRGFLARPLGGIGQVAVSNLHVVSLEPGAVRGNHYHERHTEHICVIGGTVRFLARDGGERLDIVLDGGKVPVVAVPPGVTHAIMNIGVVTSYLLCYSDTVEGALPEDCIRDSILTSDEREQT